VTAIARLLSVLAVLFLVAPSAAGEEPSAVWAALAQGGHVALVRHGNAPPGYGGDPPGMRINDCATQRNLDDAGREQARSVGEAFRAHGVRVDKVLSSPMCRCLDTARLMAVGPVESAWALLPDQDRRSPVRLSELRKMISEWRGPGTLVLVTHGFTVQALLGIVPGQAETVVVKPVPGSTTGGDVVGRIPGPQ
jgi:broad specificity phosphatase PhoE